MIQRRVPLLSISFVLLYGSLCAYGGDHPGAAIFKHRCAECHGNDGQGSADGYDSPLFGDLSITALARLIERTMPEGEPELCVGPEADSVAEYVFSEFYSLDARIRNGWAPPPRVELSRLTVGQYRNTVADLIGRWTPAPRPTSDAVAGLSAEYYQSKGMNKANQLKMRRVDSQVDFDFGQGTPTELITTNDQFAIIWTGGLAARRTGFYDFRVRSPNGIRFYVNNDRPPKRARLRDDSSVAGQAALIDAWVSSGKMRETTARLFLIGGRRYPLRLEFFKYKEASASIRLEWKPPGGIWSVLDRRYSDTSSQPRTFALSVPFPADDRSVGYERGTSISREWHEATTQAAAAATTEVIDRLSILTKLNLDVANRDELLEFVLDFAQVAFRRPLGDEERIALRELMLADASGADTALRRCLLLILQSPHFLYPDLTPPNELPTQSTIATRLALTMWDSLPDDTLADAARRGELASAAQVARQARRMLIDTRTRSKLHTFVEHWLELEDRDLTKDQAMFPGFGDEVIDDLRYSLEQFIDQVVWSEDSDYRDLLRADYLVLNDRLRNLYAQSTLGRASTRGSVRFERVSLPKGERAGVLTHPYMLTALAYHNSTSPIHRGVFLTRNIVGRGLKPPPIAVAFRDDDFAADLTMREKITQLTSDAACVSCHSVINPLGFALEHYDAVGRWRTHDNQKPVDSTGVYTTAEGKAIQVSSAKDIANFAVTSEAAQRGFVAQLFRYLVKQDPSAYGAETVERLRSDFSADQFNIQQLVVRIAVTAALHGTELDVASGGLIHE